MTIEVQTSRREEGFEKTLKSSPVYAQIISDVDFILARVRGADSISAALGYADALKSSARELSEILVSIAATASLIDYRRGDDWRLDFVGARSPAGRAIVDRLDALRWELSWRIGDIRRYVHPRRARTHPAIRRGMSLLVLALDAVHDKAGTVEFSLLAGAGIASRDLVGDAQLIAEEIEDLGLSIADESPELEAPAARLTLPAPPVTLDLFAA